MRVVLVGLNYSPEVVGIGPLTTDLAEYLVARGHIVAVLTGFPYYPHWHIDPGYRRKWPFLTEVINGVRVIRSPILLPPEKPSTFRRVLFDSSLAVTALLASTGIKVADAVVCVSPPLQLGVTAWLIARSRGARLILHIQDLVPDAALNVGMMHEGTAVRVGRRLEHFVYSRANRISVISEGFLDNLLRKGVPSAKLKLLPNWVDTARFKVARDPAVRAALGVKNGETLALHTGNMGAKQGLETLLDAAAELAGERITVTLVGDGNRRRQLERRAAELRVSNVRFRELQADLPGTLAAADLLLLAQQGAVVDSVVPSKLLSYMASGKPVVAAVNELSEAGRMVLAARCGILVAPERPDELAEAILEVHHQPDKFADLGEAGRRYVAQHYERSDVLRRWARLVEDNL